MRKTKFFISLILAVSVLMVQVASAFAAPAFQDSAPISGAVKSITLETDPNTGSTTVIVGLLDKNQVLRMVRIGEETAVTLMLVTPDGDGKPAINKLALGQLVEIDPTTIIPAQEENRHPVGSALATFFSDVKGMNYDTIMAAHKDGVGFGIIAQALWLTVKLSGDSETFQALLNARKTGNYSAFTLEDGTTPTNWGQLRKAILNGDQKNGLGPIMSGNHGNNQDKTKNNNGSDSDKDKNKGKSNNGNGNGNNK